jgi:molybdate transport system ATP-binding protein
MSLQVSLSHRFPGLALDIAFEAPPGVTALFGRSGAGKTTVVNAVAGLIRPDRARILAGAEVLTDTAAGVMVPPHRRRVGYVFQDARLFPHLTVAGNLAYGRRFAPRDAELPDAARITEMLGIGPLLARRPGTLSGGEKSRVALGRAILSAPRLLLLDEPLAALDEARKAEVLPYLERLRDEVRLPILYVSHALAEVARLATHLVLIEAGRVAAAGPVGAVLGDPGLATILGLREAGSILTVRLAAQDEDGLTRLDSAAGPLWLPRVTAPPGSLIRLRILAQDVILATRRPEGLSALNILPASVAEVRLGEGPGALVRLMVGDEPILARITRRSAVALDLAPGRAVFAVIKAVAVAQENVVPRR